MDNTFEDNYYKGQLIRSSGSLALNYGEAQETVTGRDFINKGAIVLKESPNNLKVLAYINAGDDKRRDWLLKESQELIKIMSTMILNNKYKK